MKTIHNIITAIACCLAVTSCSEDDVLTQEKETWQGNDRITLTLTTAPENRTSGSRAIDMPVDEGTAGDYHIKDFLLFQFDENGNRLVDPKYYEYTPDAPGDPGQTIPMLLPTADGVEYTVVVLANYHGNLTSSAFADATTLDRLMQTYQKIEKIEDTYKSNGSGYDLLMNGFAKIQKTTESLNMELFRNVARLTVNITNTEGSGVIIKSAQVKSVPTKVDFFYHIIDSLNPTALEAPYPKYSSFTTFDYDVDNFTVNPGESLQIIYYLPCHLMGKSAANNEKTKGVNAPDHATFIELYGISTDGQQFSRYRFYLGDNMINDYNIRPNHHYTLPLTFNKIGNPQNDSRVNIAGAIVEEPDANSYIINPIPTEEQRMYNIPVVDRINTFWQNEMIAGYVSSSTAYTIIGDNEWAAEVIWQTSKEQMIEFYDANGNITENSGRKSPTYHGLQALRFKPKKNAKGNVVIGVYRVDQQTTTREYSWSWHLWITDYNPDECVNQNWDGRYKYLLSNGSGEVHRYRGSLWDSEGAEYHNKWAMDRNLGAMEAAINNNNAAMGMRYQYGRKDPLVHNGAFGSVYKYDVNTDSYKPCAWSNSVSYSGKYKDYMVKFPYNFYSGYGSDPYWQNLWDDPDWSKEKQGGSTKKSFFDPCPPGWRIPTKECWDKIISPKTERPGGISILYLDGIVGSDNFMVCNYSPNLELYNNNYGSIAMHFSTPTQPGIAWCYYMHAGSNAQVGTYYGNRYRAKVIRPVQE